MKRQLHLLSMIVGRCHRLRFLVSMNHHLEFGSSESHPVPISAVICMGFPHFHLFLSLLIDIWGVTVPWGIFNHTFSNLGPEEGSSYCCFSIQRLGHGHSHSSSSCCCIPRGDGASHGVSPGLAGTEHYSIQWGKLLGCGTAVMMKLPFEAFLFL